MISKCFVIISLITTLVSGGTFTGYTREGNEVTVYNQDHGGPTMIETYKEEGLNKIEEYYDGHYTHASTYLVGDIKSIIRYTMERLYA